PTCLSLMVWGAGANLVEALRTYHRFHMGLLPIIDRISLVPFEVLIESPHLVFDQLALSLEVNAKYSDAIAKAVARARTEHYFLGLERSREVLRRNLPNATKEEQKSTLLQRHFTAEAKEGHA